MAQPELAIVVPTFNESRNVRKLAELVSVALSDVAYEIVFVDDNSPDGTAHIAKDLAAEDSRVRCLRRVGRRGLAGACLEGMLASAAPVVAVMDGDLQHDERILRDMLQKIREGADLVVASRNMDGGSKNEGLTPLRQKISDLGRLLANRVMKLDLSDPMSGFFMIRRELVEEIAPKLSTTGFKILADIAATLPRRPKLAEVPFVFRERVEGESKLDAKVGLDYIGFILNKLSGGIIPLRFIFFALVGATGLAVHMAALSALLTAGFQFTQAQSGATLIAMTSNYVLNNYTTYRDARLSGLAFIGGLFMFYAICSTGFLANIGVARWVYFANQSWWIAGIAGAVMAAVWNYAVSSVLVWKK